jgi:single-strand DNA-binding protein
MFNKVILVGNLTRDIEVRYTSSGMAIGKTGIATNRRFKSQSGEQKDEVMFIDLTFFGRTAEVANQYLKKGSKVLVEGRLILEQWVAQDGTKRSRHSVTVETMQMLDSRSDSQEFSNSGYGEPTYSQPPQNSYSQPQQATQQPTQVQSNQVPQEPNIPEIDIDEDEIPF